MTQTRRRVLALAGCLLVAAGGLFVIHQRGQDDHDRRIQRSVDEIVDQQSAAAGTQRDAWCSMWKGAAQKFENEDPDALDVLLPVAQAGVVLDDPTISPASQDIVDHLTWVDRSADDPTIPAPDARLFSDAIILISFECDPLTD